MLKFLIFFTLILFIQNEFTNDEKQYLKEINQLTKSTEIDIIDNFKDIFKNFKEFVILFIPLKKQISSFKFKKTEKDELGIDVNDNKDNAINKIKEHIKFKKFRKNGNEELGDLFTKPMEYDFNQWNKYDLLFSKGNTIKVLSILTKKFNNKFVTIYFTSLDKFIYPFGENIVLINKSINENNPFNNNYFIVHYQMECSKSRNPMCSISEKKLTLLYEDIIIRYYSILSYNMIAQAIPDYFPLKNFE